MKSCVCISLITRVPVLEKAASLMIFSRALVPLRGPLGLREGQGFPVLTQEGRGVGEAERQAPGPLLLPFPRSTLRWKAALWPQGSVSIPEFQHPVPASGEQVLFVWGCRGGAGGSEPEPMFVAVFAGADPTEGNELPTPPPPVSLLPSLGPGKPRPADGLCQRLGSQAWLSEKASQQGLCMRGKSAQITPRFRPELRR